jgi:hypothetical protein
VSLIMGVWCLIGAAKTLSRRQRLINKIIGRKG